MDSRPEQFTGIVIFLITISIELYIGIEWLIVRKDESLFPLYLILVFFLIYITLFFCNILVNCVFNLFIPRRWIDQNSKYYSAIPHPERLVASQPRVIIQIPVYKESFRTTIKPTLDSIITAGRYYKENCGGTFGILLHDDGLAHYKKEDEEYIIRTEYYHSIPELCYIARPVGGRKGKFKKASNLNYGMRKIKYEIPLDTAGEMFKQETDRDFPFGKYILIMDCDSRMSFKALYPLVYEMEMNDQLGFVQASTKPMKVIGNYWENLISEFTSHIYDIAFVYSSSNGNPSPLVGHNVLMRSCAIEEVSYYDEENDSIIYWAEDKVSEDFDISLRLSCKGYFGRYIGYDLGFEEGVSLSVLDEINRFSKYTYGVNEMILNPINRWSSDGILSSIIKKYILSSYSMYTKINLLAYMGSYYAMACGPILVIINYFAFRYSDFWNSKVTSSIDIILGCISVFSVLLPISNIVVKWKTPSNKMSVLKILLIELKYTVLMSLFFSGMGYHIMTSLVKHLFSLNIG